MWRYVSEKVVRNNGVRVRGGEGTAFEKDVCVCASLLNTWRPAVVAHEKRRAVASGIWSLFLSKRRS
jgi:hypothetical protein